MFLCQGFAISPSYAEVRNVDTHYPDLSEDQVLKLFERLKKWDPSIDIDQCQITLVSPVVWNNGALGCPIEGKFYTQALVPGFLILVQNGDTVLEVHTDQALRAIALPEAGLI